VYYPTRFIMVTAGKQGEAGGKLEREFALLARLTTRLASMADLDGIATLVSDEIARLRAVLDGLVREQADRVANEIRGSQDTIKLAKDFLFVVIDDTCLQVGCSQTHVLDSQGIHL